MYIIQFKTIGRALYGGYTNVGLLKGTYTTTPFSSYNDGSNSYLLTTYSPANNFLIIGEDDTILDNCSVQVGFPFTIHNIIFKNLKNEDMIQISNSKYATFIYGYLYFFNSDLIATSSCRVTAADTLIGCYHTGISGYRSSVNQKNSPNHPDRLV